MASSYTRLTEEKGNADYGSTPKVGYAKGSSTEFFQLCDKITTNLFTINKAATNLERSKKIVGTQEDSQLLRDRITQLNADTGSYIQDTTMLLKSVNNLTHGDKQRKIRSQKLQTEFQAAATRFSEVQKKVLNAVRIARLPVDMVATEMDAESSATEQLVNEGEKVHAQRKELQAMEFELAMQQEREQQIRTLESDIVDINDIMRELSSMVSDQGEMISSIEDNVETAHGHVEEGREELIKASAYQDREVEPSTISRVPYLKPLEFSHSPSMWLYTAEAQYQNGGVMPVSYNKFCFGRSAEGHNLEFSTIITKAIMLHFKKGDFPPPCLLLRRELIPAVDCIRFLGLLVQSVFNMDLSCLCF